MSGEIRFAPCPENTFEQHISEYYERSREKCPKIEAIYGKWRFEDLIPGMSDFDTRFIVSSDTAPEDWVHMSREVGRIHADICRRHPGRARILEHLPGVNLTWAETRDPSFYYPEFHQWTAYFGFEHRIAEFGEYLNNTPWNETDEMFNVKKFALYFTPYDRTIDPPINLHEFESKYPLHSRFMHYFCPPLQSAVSIARKRMIRGKAESLRYAREMFPDSGLIDMIMEAVDRHYEIPEWYEESAITRIEERLFTYLREVFRIIQPEISVIDASPEDTSKDLKAKLSDVNASSAAMDSFYEGAKFCRLMMGRLLFYAEDIPLFESSWLIGHEIRRIRRLFYETTFTSFARIAWGANMTPEESLERCRGAFLNEADYRAVKAYADIFSEPWKPAEIKKFAVRVAERMGDFQIVLEKLAATARMLSRQGTAT